MILNVSNHYIFVLISFNIWNISVLCCIILGSGHVKIINLHQLLATFSKVCYFAEKNCIMELYEGLITRRSVRKYTGGIISKEDVKKIMIAGMYAPSARNKMPWHFVVIDDKNIFSKIMDFHPYSLMLSNASHAIVVCGDENLHNGPGYYIMDCSAAAENMLLAAHALGFGAVWIGIHPKPDRIEAMSALLGLPQHVKPVALISLGVPEEMNESDCQRYNTDRIRYNHWEIIPKLLPETE